MANEISLRVKLSAKKYTAELSLTYAKFISMAGSKMHKSVQNIGTTAEAIVYGDMTSADVGLIVIRNLSTAYFVQISLDYSVTNQIFAKLLPGQMLLLPPKTATLYAKSSAATSDIEIIATQL